ncbi:MAG: efflux RND transporter periplasmic adaptor subunit [Fimbriimonas sp.]|nr:efflux RND transporter periplasmic adaptor subunit [Fimbriimonas sp.]
MKKAILMGVPILVLLALVGWRYTQKVQTGKQLASRSSGLKNGPANVVLAVAGPHRVVKSIEAVGSVESPFAVELSPKLTGKIVYLPDEVREGYPVKTGQLLAQIDPTETIGQVLQAKSQLAQAQSNLVSAKYIQDPTNANVASQIEQATATVNSNQADYDQVFQNYQDEVHQAHSVVVDAQAKVAAAKAATYNAEAGYESARANLDNAQSKLNREDTLYRQGYVAAQDRDDAVAAEKVAAANLKVADGLVRSAKQAEVSVEQQEKEAEYNESIVSKTGKTNIRAAFEKVKLAQAALKYARSNTNQKPAYAAQLRALQAAVDAAQGNLNQAQARLADCNLVSTIDGTVSKRLADRGSVVNAGNSILEVQYMNWLYVNSAVPVEYTGIVVKGTPVTMTFDAIPGLKMSGTVTELSNVADPQNRQFTAKIRIDNAAGRFRPGMYAAVKFQVSNDEYPVVVPREAVRTTNDGLKTVTSVDSTNVAHIVDVTTGEQDTSHVVIKDGLNAGDRVVILSYTTVRDKQKIVEGGKPKASKGTSPAAGSPADGQGATQGNDGEPPQGGSKRHGASHGSEAVAGTGN